MPPIRNPGGGGSGGSGTVTGVLATSPLASDGNPVTPTISISSSTGSGAVVLATSPTLTTPIIGSYTFATLPSAASNSGAVVRVTDIGPATAGSLWVSTGTIWKPVNGRVTIVSSAASASTSSGEVLSNLKFQFPAAFFNAGDRIRLWGSLTKGAATNQGLVAVRVGTAGTTADTVVIPSWAAMANASRTTGFITELTVVDATTMRAEGAVPLAGNTGAYTVSTNVVAANVTISNVSNSLWVEVTISSSSDAFALVNGMMEYISV